MDDWELKRQELSDAAAKAIEDLMQHMGQFESFRFSMADGRSVTVVVQPKP